MPFVVGVDSDQTRAANPAVQEEAGVDEPLDLPVHGRGLGLRIADDVSELNSSPGLIRSNPRMSPWAFERSSGASVGTVVFI